MESEAQLIGQSACECSCKPTIRAHSRAHLQILAAPYSSRKNRSKAACRSGKLKYASVTMTFLPSSSR